MSSNQLVQLSPKQLESQMRITRKAALIIATRNGYWPRSEASRMLAANLITALAEAHPRLALLDAEKLLEILVPSEGRAAIDPQLFGNRYQMRSIAEGFAFADTEQVGFLVQQTHHQQQSALHFYRQTDAGLDEPIVEFRFLRMPGEAQQLQGHTHPQCGRLELWLGSSDVVVFEDVLLRLAAELGFQELFAGNYELRYCDAFEGAVGPLLAALISQYELRSLADARRSYR